MYADPSHKHVHVTKLRFNKEEMRLLRAAAKRAQLQPAVYCRERLLEIAERILSAGSCQDKESLLPKDSGEVTA